jgi:hypothetical protein
VGTTAIVVNTLSDRLPDPAAFEETPPRCAVDAKARNPECSLRAAIELANKLGGKQTITFDVPGGGVPQIVPGFSLPPVTASVSIDGTTQLSLAAGSSCQGRRRARATVSSSKGPTRRYAAW